MPRFAASSLRVRFKTSRRRGRHGGWRSPSCPTTGGPSSSRCSRRPRPGPRAGDRAALTGILFVLRTGIPWGMLPPEMGCGSGSICWRRLRDWKVAGVWDALHRALLDRLGAADRID